MPVKIYYGEEIHRLSNLPGSLRGLTDKITSLFRSQLPHAWILQQKDDDGDLITITHDLDYKELLDLEALNVLVTIKLVVTEAEYLSTTPSPTTTEKDNSSSFISRAKKDQTDYEVFGLTELQVRILENKLALMKMVWACRRRCYSLMHEYHAALESIIPELKPMLDRAIFVVSSTHSCCGAKRAMRVIKREFMAQFFPQGGFTTLKQWSQYNWHLKKSSRQQTTNRSCGWFWGLFRRTSDDCNITRLPSGEQETLLREDRSYSKVKLE